MFFCSCLMPCFFRHVHFFLSICFRNTSPSLPNHHVYIRLSLFLSVSLYSFLSHLHTVSPQILVLAYMHLCYFTVLQIYSEFTFGSNYLLLFTSVQSHYERCQPITVQHNSLLYILSLKLAAGHRDDEPDALYLLFLC